MHSFIYSCSIWAGLRSVAPVSGRLRLASSVCRPWRLAREAIHLMIIRE